MAGETKTTAPAPPAKPSSTSTVAPPKAVLEITSPGVPNADKMSRGAPVRVNDDHDNGKFWPANPPAPHRELEPIFDFEHLEDTPNEDDLLEIKLDVKPAGQKGNVTLNVQSQDAADSIRLWPKKTKGKATDVITLTGNPPQTQFAANTLPKSIFVEGLKPGQVLFEVNFPGASVDRLKINVVKLRVQQTGRQKIIYLASEEVFFRVLGAGRNEVVGYTFEWDLDGDGRFEITSPMPGKDPNVVTTKYGGSPQLPPNAANTRKVFDVAVRLNGNFILHATDGLFTGGGAAGIRVALDSHQGTALPADNTAGLHTVPEFRWSDTFPIKFDSSSAPGFAQFKGADRILFDRAVTGDAAQTVFLGTGKRQAFGVAVGPRIFTSGQVREDLIATVNHEIKHLQQYVAVRDNTPAGNIWKLLDDHFSGANGYKPFREVEGHFSELLDTRVSWRHHTPEGQNEIKSFVDEWNKCLTILPSLPVPVKVEARKFLQDIYRKIPFFEMKRSQYTDAIRAPE